MSIKVSKLAEELGLKPADLLESLHKMYIDAEDGDSVIDDKIAALMKIKLGKGVAEKKKTVKKKAVKKAVKSKNKTEDKETDEQGPESKKKGRKKKEPEKEDVKEAPESEKDKDGKPSGRSTREKKLDTVIVVKAATEEEKKEIERKEKKKDKGEKLKGTGKKEKDGVKRINISVDFGAKASADDDEGEAKGPKGKTKKIFKPSKSMGAKPYKKIFHKKGKKFFPSAQSGPTEGIAFEQIKPYEGDDYQKLSLAMPTDIRSIAVKVNKRANDLMQYLIKKGIFININQVLDEKMARDLLKDLGYELEIEKTIEEDLMAEHEVDEKTHMVPRAPIVTFMGHVDHGKTSLLDRIRETMVAAKEKGGITQHIGAYKVETKKGAVAFLDTPGHEAFTAMRARGANATDVVVLVVAADDGVMPQTKEAIGHAKAAGVPIIVAINKCDLPGADPGRVKIDMQREDLVSEEFGGQTVFVEVSAKTGQGVQELVEMLMLESELLELKANPDLRARGIIVEAKKSSGQGVTSTVLVQNGTLKIGDIVLSGIYYGKVKAMINDRGERIENATPSTPVEILGLQGVPEAGDAFHVVKDEKKARTLAMLKQQQSRKKKMAGSQRISLEDFHGMVEGGEVKELKIILRADVQGSVEAITQAVTELSTGEVSVSFVQAVVGDISESDVMLAMVSNAVVIGFHVKIEGKAEALAKSEKVDVRVYDIIYEAINDIKAAMEGLLEPIENEVIQGYAQIRQVFSAKSGKAAGCMVTKGAIGRKDLVRIKRNKEIIYDGTFSALRRFKDDVKEVREGFECGMSFQGHNDIKEGDLVEVYTIEKIARRLEKPAK